MLVNDVKLNNCPFCGGKAKIHLYLSKYYANCKKCKTFSAPYDTAEQAAAAWNTRACKYTNASETDNNGYTPR
ncbi:MAG: Lar family restriction alleviation protein [Neisseriaceae bacterium]|nr:Lar family restriction alleviation protein [Neisseriaceae bacterium]